MKKSENMDRAAYPRCDSREMGFTKREVACMMLGVPESGDEELDELIKKGSNITTITQTKSSPGKIGDGGIAYGCIPVLNKAEVLAASLRVCASGDPEIDELITLARRQDYIKAALTGLLGAVNLNGGEAVIASNIADASANAILAADAVMLAE